LQKKVLSKKAFFNFLSVQVQETKAVHRIEVFMLAKLHIAVFWVTDTRLLVDGYQDGGIYPPTAKCHKPKDHNMSISM
jgi:hypothetical protein